jgi:hypothetical protein
MASLSYCRSCFEHLLIAESLSDEMRLKELMAAWSPKGPVSIKGGVCARCGTEGEVLHYEIVP